MARNKTRVGRRGRAYWTELAALYEASPCRQREFAAQHDVNLGTFRSWLYRLREEARDGATEARSPAGFAEVVTRAVPRSDAMPCVLRVGATELRFEQAPSASYLAELLARVGA